MNTWHPLPPEVFSFVEQTPGTVLLHSSRPGGSGTSRLFAAPLRIIEVRNLSDLTDLFETIEAAVSRRHFAAGFMAYESAQYFEPSAVLKSVHNSDLLAWFGIYDSSYIFDHRLGTFNSTPPVLPPAKPERDGRDGHLSTSIDFALNEQRFTDQVGSIHDYIRAGDVYQLNFTFPLHATLAEPPAAVYARLSAAQPVEYGAFLHCQPGRHILSFSPELFFRIDRERRITTQPMKGTAPRGRTTAEDRDIAAWLARDTKNRAENVMIVDLIRNDLGRLCTFGSVTVETLFEVDRYPSLWQMTSRISGDLRQNAGYQEIFRALFPCGSITGAPKVRAMQLLTQLEVEPRGVYTGAIGYFSPEQTVFNVAIRTLQLEKSTAVMGIGAGIVIDSDPAAEYRECQLKAEFLTRSAEPFFLIETMLWNGTFPLLELHLDRMEDSANYFDFSCNRPAVRGNLLDHASSFLDARPRKVRILLSVDGAVHIESTVLPDSGDVTIPLRVGIAARRTDPADWFLFHKTTCRQLYVDAYASADSFGFADILFLNVRGEVTEGAVHNIFIEKSGWWYTPALECGLLPGIYRRHLLQTHADAEEKILTQDDLKAADGVYICNAIRGLRRVTIDWSTSMSGQ
ncbi:MAG TPA: aminodeoxychorismate synthase component I [Terracidiphilus sp.]|nr:aminodeoxychorismate synthase component I [Terracidiphilus sp.]